MPEYIKAYDRDQWKGDVIFEVPSMEEFAELKTQINALKKQISNRITEATLNNKVSIVDEKITTMKESIKTLKNEIVSSLQNGMWKQSFTQEIEKAMNDLENRFSELNKLLDEKMMELPRLDAIEANINAVFLTQGDKIKNIIINEGKSVCEQIQQQTKQRDLLSILDEEAQSITWENKP